MYCKRGQLAIFIILALIIIGALVGYFVLRGRIRAEIPTAFRPVEEKFLGCIEDYARFGISTAGVQGGYIYLPEFEPGSAYKPFSSQLDFMGFGVPYWYYVSGNNIIREQVPSKQDIQSELEQFIEESLEDCNFEEFYARNYEIDIENINANVEIQENKVNIMVSADLTASLENDSYIVRTHEVEIDSKLGKFYSLALKIYNKEKTSMFLEQYALDVLRLYAPVDGVELTCSPQVWLLNDVVSDLQDGLEANIQSIRLDGNYYTLSENERKYFVVDLDTDEAVNFIYSRNWPVQVNVDPTENSILMAEPVGNQEGLGILGFCYVPYHFVYDVDFPVLIQVYDEDEMFQFPVAVVIQGNEAREALETTSAGEIEPEICRYKNQEVRVYTYDSELEPVEAQISFKCFSERCDIGETKIKEGEAVLVDNFPQCVNGYIIAKADGYADSKYVISTNSESRADILLSKLYDMDVSVKLDGKETSERTFVYYRGKSEGVIIWPDQREVELAEGYYNITIYVYKNSSISVPASSSQKCVEVLKPGLMGVFGATTEECFELNIPAQTLENAIIGGGKTSWYISESELQQSSLVEFEVEKIDLPRSIEDLQNAYNEVEYNSIDIGFK